MILRKTLRLDDAKLTHKKALDILSSLPNRRMNEFIIQAIINADNENHIREIITETMIDVIGNYDISEMKSAKEKTIIDNDALSFIDNL